MVRGRAGVPDDITVRQIVTDARSAEATGETSCLASCSAIRPKFAIYGDVDQCRQVRWQCDECLYAMHIDYTICIDNKYTVDPSASVLRLKCVVPGRNSCPDIRTLSGFPVLIVL